MMMIEIPLKYILLFTFVQTKKEPLYSFILLFPPFLFLPSWNWGLSESMEGAVCGFCGKVGQDLQVCGRCRAVFYCYVTCQRSTWKTHKPNCHQKPRNKAVATKMGAS